MCQTVFLFTIPIRLISRILQIPLSKSDLKFEYNYLPKYSPSRFISEVKSTGFFIISLHPALIALS